MSTNHKLLFEGKTPLYAQLKEKILEDIRGGILRPGDTIPAESALSEKYQVSRATVRQAITELVHEGLLIRKQGRGTFVNKPKIETRLKNVYSFSQDMTSRGLHTESELIEFEIVLPKQDVKEKLKLSNDELVIKLLRLRQLEEDPIMMETTFLPYARFQGLTQQHIKESKSLYTLLEKTYDVKIDHVVDCFEPVLIDDFNSRMLDVPKGAPALYLERIGYLDEEQRVEMSQSVVRGDRCRYFVELFRT